MCVDWHVDDRRLGRWLVTAAFKQYLSLPVGSVRASWLYDQVERRSKATHAGWVGPLLAFSTSVGFLGV
jgi:hypothetical protein